MKEIGPRGGCTTMLLLNIGSIRIYILTTGVVSNETNTYVRMYIWRIYSSRYLDTLLHKLKWRTLENAGLYTLATKDWEMWELLLTGDYSIELQLHEKLSHLRTKLWSVIPLFASLIAPGGVNGNLCKHLAHQTAGGTIECHSCN